MKFAVNKFFAYKPASRWAFDVAFSDIHMISTKTNDGDRYLPLPVGVFSNQDLIRLNQSVVSITQPKFDIKRNTKTYGNFDFEIPMYDANNIQLVVTFEDTDDCLISYKLISALQGNISANLDIPAWINVHPGIYLTIYEYDTYKNDAVRPNTYDLQATNYNTTSVKTYYCKMIGYTEPVYSRTSESASATTVQITFLAVPEQTYIGNNSPISVTETEMINFDENMFDNMIANAEKVINNLKIVGSNLIEHATGLMAVSADRIKLNELVDYAKQHNISLNTFNDVLDFVTHNYLAEVGQRNCTRGIALVHQLYDYIISGQAAAGNAVTYESAPEAHKYNQAARSTNTKNMFTDESLAVTVNALPDMNALIKDQLKVPGDYITFQYKHADGTSSQHIVQLGTDGKYYSDFTQATATGLAAGANTFTDIQMHRLKVDVVNQLEENAAKQGFIAAKQS